MRIVSALLSVACVASVACQPGCVRKTMPVDRPPPSTFESEIEEPDESAWRAREPVEREPAPVDAAPVDAAPVERAEPTHGARQPDACDELARGAVIDVRQSDDGAELVVTPDPGWRAYDAALRLRGAAESPKSERRCGLADLAQKGDVRFEVQREGTSVVLRFTSTDPQRAQGIREELDRFVVERGRAPGPEQPATHEGR